MQKQTTFELYTDDNKSKHSSTPKDILKSAKKFLKNSTPIEESTWGVLSKKVFLKISYMLQENSYTRVYLNKVADFI